MNDKNEKLKKTLLHYINLEYYANGLDEEFQELLAELESRCMNIILSQTSINTKATYSAIMKLIREEVGMFQDELKTRLEENAQLIMEQELDFLDKTYNTGSIAALTLGGIALSKLLFAPIDGRDTTAQFTQRTSKNIIQSYDTSLRSGYLFGQNTEDLNKQITNKLKQVSRGMQSGIRTAIPAYAKTTDRIVFLNNNVEVVYCATLDGNTCISCGVNHGRHFKSIAEAPSIPIHANCRCVYISSLEAKEPMPTFEEFIDSLPEKDQRHILTNNRYELRSKYGISLSKFLNNGTVMANQELNDSLGITNNKNLIIPDSKLTEYALNSAKSKGKVEVFKSSLGYTLDNYKDLKENILDNLNQKDMHFVEEDEFGKRYRCDLKITGPNGNTAEIRTGWIKEPDSDELQLRLTTIYVR